MSEVLIFLQVDDSPISRNCTIEMVEIALTATEHALKLISPELPEDNRGPHFSMTCDDITLGEKTYPYQRYRCNTPGSGWDAVWVSPQIADRIALDCLEGGWEIDEWNDGPKEGWSEAEIRERLEEWLRDQEAAKYQLGLFNEVAA